jgi:hypothetical protein
VPLSEDEQRILSQIEQSFYEHDPDTAQKLRDTTVYRDAGTKLKLAIAGFVVGFAVMLGLFTTSLWLGALGIGIMIISALYAERNVRRMGRAGWSELQTAMSERSALIQRRRNAE